MANSEKVKMNPALVPAFDVLVAAGHVATETFYNTARFEGGIVLKVKTAKKEAAE